jgi:transcriptional regulator with XRE-family HTH domain
MDREGDTMRTAALLDLARERAGIPSDYALASRIGCTRSVVSMWRSGKSFPEALYCWKLADLCGIDALHVIADVELDRAERYSHEDVANEWRSILSRIGGAAAAVLMGTVLSSPSPANASMKKGPNEQPPSVYYVNQP